MCEIFRTTNLRACRQPVCARYVGQHFLAHAGCAYARDILDNVPSRMQAFRMREIFWRNDLRACRQPVSARYVRQHSLAHAGCVHWVPAGTPAGPSNQLRLGKKDIYLSLSKDRPGESSTTTSIISAASMSMPRRNPPRSARPTDCTDQSWYPNIRDPGSDVDRQIQTLNGEAYPADVFGRVDDLLMFTLFATKKAKQPRKRHHHAVIPEQASDRPMTLTIEEGAEAAQICRDLLSGKEASMDEVRKAVSELQRKIPPFRSPKQGWAPCLRQCVQFLVDFEGGLIFGSDPTQVCFTGTRLFIRREVQSRSARWHIKATRCHSA